MSLRAINRVTGVARNTINSLLLDLGAAATEYQDRTLRNLDCQRIECDEIWSFVHAKDRNLPEKLRNEPGYGSVWTWTAIDADTKLVPSWLVGERTMRDAYEFLSDLKSRRKVGIRPQLTTDGLGIYPPVVDSLWRNSIDYATMQKEYGTAIEDERRYSPAICTGVDVRIITGDPDPDLISTSYVERQNLTMRMGMRRYTRLTNGHSKALEQHVAAVALHFLHYNFARPNMALGKRVTPAMAAGIEGYPWSLMQIAELLD